MSDSKKKMSSSETRELEYISYLNSLIDEQNSVQTDDSLIIPNLTSKPPGTQFVSLSKPVFEQKYAYMKSSEHNDFLVIPSHSDIDLIQHFPEILFVKQSKSKHFMEDHDYECMNDIKLKFRSDTKWHSYFMFQFREFKEGENDCLGFTEYILTGDFQDDRCILAPKTLDYSKYKKVKPFPQEKFEPEDGSPEYDPTYAGLIGNSDPHNVRLSMIMKKHYSKMINQSLSADVDDAVMITYTKWHTKKSSGQVPYHVAPVIGRDDNYILTLEADAGDETRTRPVFDIYSLDHKSKQTFWDVHNESYGGKTAVAFTVYIPESDSEEEES